MQHGAKRSLCHFVLEDSSARLVGLAGMDHERQPGRAGRRDMGAETALLRPWRAVVIEIIQPRLAQRHHLGMAREFDQLGGGNAVFFVGVMRMGADRTIDVRKPLGDLDQFGKPPHPRRDGDHASNAGGSGPRHDAIEVVGEIGKVQMAMAIDQHRLGPFTPPVRCSAEIPAPAPAARCPV
jgi:hypothetical protein